MQNNNALESIDNIKLEEYSHVINPRRSRIMIDFLKYIKNNKIYNHYYLSCDVTFKEFLQYAAKVSKDISDMFGEADMQYKYISAISNLEKKCYKEHDLAFKVIDYWWTANMIKNRHQDSASYNFLRNQCITSYNNLKEEASKNYILEQLGKEFLNIK